MYRAISQRSPVAAAIGCGVHRAFSLVELLVASTMSLVVMAAVVSLFGVFSRTVSDGQSLAEVSGRMRNAAWRLRQDLVGVTCIVAPLVRAEANAGYFQVIEGPRTTSTDPSVLVGDIDDVLALTSSSPNAAFAGRLNGAAGFESPMAELAWFCEPSGQLHKGQPLYNLHRRQLLVAGAPGAGGTPFANAVFIPYTPPPVRTPPQILKEFWLTSDLSCRVIPSPDNATSFLLFANTLGDLSKTPNRFLTLAGADRKLIVDPSNPLLDREGEDVILGNVIAFDVRVAEGGPLADRSFQTSETGDPTAGLLRGIEVRLRCIDPATDRSRELKVVHSFGVL